MTPKPPQTSWSSGSPRGGSTPCSTCPAAGSTFDDPTRCPDQIREALTIDGAIIIEAVVNEHEPPIPARAKKSQVEPLLRALRQGTPNRNRIALQIVKDLLDESSFQASPSHRIPDVVGKVAGKVVDTMSARAKEDGPGGERPAD